MSLSFELCNNEVIEVLFCRKFWLLKYFVDRGESDEVI